jgi:hypothetical protein
MDDTTTTGHSETRHDGLEDGVEASDPLAVPILTMQEKKRGDF